METAKHINTILDIRERLTSFLESDPVPTVKQQLELEIKSLDWTFNELAKTYLSQIVMIIGDAHYIKQATNLDIKHDDKLCTIVIVYPGDVVIEKVKALVSPGWSGNKLIQKNVPPFLICDRYFASCDNKDENRRAVLFNGFVWKKWIEQAGEVGVKVTLKQWMTDVFNTLDWGIAQKV